MLMIFLLSSTQRTPRNSKKNDGVNATINSFSHQYPDERVIFSSATTFSKFQGQSRRGIARRGVVIFTEQQIFFKSVLLSLYSFIYIFGALICFWFFFRTQNFYYLIVGIIVGAMIIQRLPLQESISFKDIKGAELDTVPGNLFTGGKRFHRLKIISDEKIMFFGLAPTLPDEIKQKLGLSGENNSSSQSAG
jgi:hypothetical protein